MEKDYLFCPVCERKTKSCYSKKYKGKSELFYKKDLYQCLACKIIFTHPLPHPPELDQYYKTIWLRDENIISLSKEAESVYKIQGDVRCDYLIRHNAVGEGFKLLDIGSGYGYFFRSLQNRSIKNLIFFATDPSPICLEKLKKIGVNAFDSLSEISEKNFDLITLGQVLEHIPNPNSFLKSIIKLVRSGGHIYIDVPYRDDTHKTLFEPHLLFYSKESLLNLVNNLNLKVIHVTGFGVKRSNFIFPKILFHRISTKIKSVLRTIFTSAPMNEQLERKLYDRYQFDQEGEEGWWIRIILRVY